MPECPRTAIWSSMALVALTVACGGDRSEPPTSGPSAVVSTPAPPHVEVRDPIGDAPRDARIAVSPDLMSAAASIAAGNFTVVIHFAPGTADRSTTWVRINLDTDRNRATGNREPNGTGTDYSVLALASGRSAALQKSEPDACATGGICVSGIGSVPLSFAGDTMQVVVPLALLGLPEQPRMFFQVRTWPVVDQQSLVALIDSLPDDHLPPGSI